MYYYTYYISILPDFSKSVDDIVHDYSDELISIDMVGFSIENNNVPITKAVTEYIDYYIERVNKNERDDV